MKIRFEFFNSLILLSKKGKGDALLTGNYRGLKLQEQARKVLEHILNTSIREQISIDEMQYAIAYRRLSLTELDETNCQI